MNRPAADGARVRLLRPLRAYFRQVAGLLVIGSLAGIAMNVAVVLPSVLLGRAVDTVAAYSAGHTDGGAVTAAVLLLVAGSLATEIPRIGKRYWLGVARGRVRANLRSDALRGVLAWPADRLHTTAIGEVIARIVGDVEVVGTAVGEVIVESWDTLLFSASLIVAMLWYDPTLGVFALAPVPVALALAKAAGKAVSRRTIAARTTYAALTSFVQEGLTGLRVLKVTGRAGTWAARMSRVARRQAEAELAVTRFEAALAPVYTTITSAGVLAVLWYGGIKVADGRLSIGDLVAFLSLFARFTGRAFRIPQMANRVQAGAAALTRLRPLLAPPPPLADEPPNSSWRTTRVNGMDTPARPGLRPVHASASRVMFDQVAFTYPGGATRALAGVSFVVEPGQFVAVTGPVGSGKSAVARLAAGLYPPDSGTATVDDAAPYLLAPADRGHLGYLSQGNPAFSGTIAENIALSDSEPEMNERVWEALRIAALTRDLTAMPDGIGTAVGELGLRLSGGQRQRLALARALAAPPCPPRLLVLDDPFSALDLETENEIVHALRASVGPRAAAPHRASILLCTTRLAACAHADKVIVLDHGRIAEIGSHPGLLAEEGLYAHIYQAQIRTAAPGWRP